MSLEGVETYKVHESLEKPGHNQWPVAFLDASGALCVIFQNIRGNLAQEPSYDYREHPEKYAISLICMQWREDERRFSRLWEKSLKAATPFCVMAPTPTISGKTIGVCKAGALLAGDDVPPEAMVVVATTDQGRSFTRLAQLAVAGANLWPNDIRCIGDKIYLTAYDGRGGAYLAESSDDGRTWSTPFRFAAAHDNMSFHEPTLAALSDHSLMIVMRTHRMDIPRQNGINYHYVRLIRGGDGIWRASAPVDTGFGFRGRPFLHRTDDGMLILACPGHFMAFSLNDGRTWESGLYDFGIPEVTITDSEGTRPYSHNADTMLVGLPDGRLYYSYFVGSDLPFPPPCDEYIGGTFFSLHKN